MPYLSRPPGQVGFSRVRYGHAPPSGLPFQGYGQASASAVSVAPVMGPQRVYKMTLPENPEAASMVSLDYIHALVRDGREDPIVRRKAYQIVRAAGVRERDYAGIIRAIHHWIQRHVRYEHDPAGVEFLTQARVLIDQVERGEAFEDCDSFVLLEHALLNSLGVPTRSVIIAADRRAPDQWSHIFLEAYDTKRKQWVTLDPIMKNKPVGWHPPKFFRRRAVPIADGPPFPPRTQMGQPAQLPAGMTVEYLPTQPSRTSVAQFYSGTVGGWHGFAGYGAEFTEQRPTCVYPADPTGQGPGPGWWSGWATHIAITILRQHPEVQPQQMEAASWVRHMDSQLRQQLGPGGFVGLQYRDKDQDYLFAQAHLVQMENWLRPNHPEIAAEMAQAIAHIEECSAQQEEWSVWYQAERAPRNKIGQLQQEVRELLRMRAEALSYVLPILDSLAPLIPLAEHHMARIEERQSFTKIVNEVVEWTSRALTALGPVTGGLTEILGIAIQVGNMAYQVRQAESMATGSAATVLGNIANAMEQADQLIRASQEVADMASTRAAKIQEILNVVLQAHPEWAPTVAEEAQAVAAELQAQPTARAISMKTVAAVGAAAAGLVILAAVA